MINIFILFTVYFDFIGRQPDYNPHSTLTSTTDSGTWSWSHFNDQSIRKMFLNTVLNMSTHQLSCTNCSDPEQRRPQSDTNTHTVLSTVHRCTQVYTVLTNTPTNTHTPTQSGFQADVSGRSPPLSRPLA